MDLKRIENDLRVNGYRYALKLAGTVEITASIGSMTQATRVEIASYVEKILCLTLLAGEKQELTSINTANINRESLTTLNASVQLAISTGQLSIYDPRFWRILMSDVSMIYRRQERDEDGADKLICVVAKISDQENGGEPQRKAIVFEAGTSELAGEVYKILGIALRLSQEQPRKRDFVEFVEEEEELDSGNPTELDGKFEPAPFNAASNRIAGLNDSRYKRLVKGLGALPFFHGAIDRDAADGLLTHDGDYLLRQSDSSTRINQVILCGRRDGRAKHVCLIESGGKLMEGTDGSDSSASPMSIANYIEKHKGKEFKGVFLLANPVNRHRS